MLHWNVFVHEILLCIVVPNVHNEILIHRIKFVAFIEHSMDLNKPLELGLLSLVIRSPSWASPPAYMTLPCSSNVLVLVSFFSYYMWVTWLLLVMIHRLFLRSRPSSVSNLIWKIWTPLAISLDSRSHLALRGSSFSKPYMPLIFCLTPALLIARPLMVHYKPMLNYMPHMMNHYKMLLSNVSW